MREGESPSWTIANASSTNLHKESTAAELDFPDQNCYDASTSQNHKSRDDGEAAVGMIITEGATNEDQG